MSSNCSKVIDISNKIVYYMYMDEKRLSILQVQEVLRWSYPTALKWAKDNGEKVIEAGREKWYVPAHVVAIEVQTIVNGAEDMQRRFVAMLSNGQ